nr:hypothetical protein CFP56_14301 [Quercus suber]
MGACFSCRSSQPFKSIRVVHFNGYVEDFEHPVSVNEVTAKSPKHFVCTPAQLLSNGSKPLKPDTQLELGKIYFLLPFSTLQADVSPMDLASIVRKLTTVAKTSPLWSQQHGSNPATSPNRFMETEKPVVAYGAPRKQSKSGQTELVEQQEENRSNLSKSKSLALDLDHASSEKEKELVEQACLCFLSMISFSLHSESKGLEISLNRLLVPAGRLLARASCCIS